MILYGWTGLDQMDGFQKFCGSGLDWIQFCQDWAQTEKFSSPLISVTLAFVMGSCLWTASLTYRIT